MNQFSLPQGFVLCTLFASLVVAAPPDSARHSEADENQDYYVIETRHRLYPKFVQVDTVSTEQSFFIGEDELEARVVLFNPHLGITPEGEILQLSDTLYNPAVRIRVVSEGELIQESWGFYRMSAPHFSRTDFLGFRLLDFRVGKPYVQAP